MAASDPRPSSVIDGNGRLIGQLVNDPGGGVSLENFLYTGDAHAKQSQLLVAANGVSLNGVLVDVTQPQDGQTLTYDAASSRVKFKPGIAGPAGPQGPAGATGPTGPAGPGVPTGGTTGQVLAKTSATDYATGWTTPAAAPTVGYGTALPGSPVDGQEFILVDNTANPSYQWRFRYNAGSQSAYKWEFVGGSSFYVAGANTATVNVNTWWNPVSGLQTPALRAGVYRATANAMWNSTSTAFLMWIGLNTTNASPAHQFPTLIGGPGYGFGYAEDVLTIAANAAIQPVFNQAGGAAGNVVITTPVLLVTPLRVS